MSSTLFKAIVALVLFSAVLAFSLTRYRRTRTLDAIVQVVGGACLVVVALTHVAEAVGAAPWMGWGEPHSACHYLDFSSAVLGVTLTPVGYALGVLRESRRS